MSFNHVKSFQVLDLVEFVASPSEAEKFALYRQCDTVIYTPPNEHFGIVPIEALEQRRPVIVCDSGGPSETVLEDITGSKVCLVFIYENAKPRLLGKNSFRVKVLLTG